MIWQSWGNSNLSVFRADVQKNQAKICATRHGRKQDKGLVKPTFLMGFKLHCTSLVWSLEVYYGEISRLTICGEHRRDGQSLKRGYIHTVMWSLVSLDHRISSKMFKLPYLYYSFQSGKQITLP